MSRRCRSSGRGWMSTYSRNMQKRCSLSPLPLRFRRRGWDGLQLTHIVQRTRRNRRATRTMVLTFFLTRSQRSKSSCGYRQGPTDSRTAAAVHQNCTRAVAETQELPRRHDRPQNRTPARPWSRRQPRPPHQRTRTTTTTTTTATTAIAAAATTFFCGCVGGG